jgi:hypothetical protein
MDNRPLGQWLHMTAAIDMHWRRRRSEFWKPLGFFLSQGSVVKKPQDNGNANGNDTTCSKGKDDSLKVLMIHDEWFGLIV